MCAAFAPSARVAGLPEHYFDRLHRHVLEVTADDAGDPSIPALIDLSRGDPDLPTPRHIVEAMQRAVADPANHRYPPFFGSDRSLSAIAARYREQYGVELDPATEITTFHGSHEAVMALPQALLDPGDTILLADPHYPLYEASAALGGVRLEYFPLDAARGFQPDFDAVTADQWQRARLLLLNFPHNPTGALAAPETFRSALAHARDAGIPVVNDFAYSSLGFDGNTPRSILQDDPGKERAIELSTLSKTYSMAGWRFGYAVGNASLIAALKAYQAVAYSTVFGAVHDAAAVALTADQGPAEAIVAEYEARRDLLVAGLREAGYAVTPSPGSFFLWLRAPHGLTGEAFADRLLRECRIAVAPGIGFGEAGRDYVRIGLVSDREAIAEAARRMGALA